MFVCVFMCVYVCVYIYIYIYIYIYNRGVVYFVLRYINEEHMRYVLHNY